MGRLNFNIKILGVLGKDISGWSGVHSTSKVRIKKVGRPGLGVEASFPTEVGCDAKYAD